MAEVKGTTKQDFPEVKGKIVDSVELDVEASFYAISVFFQDKTSLTFSMEPCIVAFPVYSEWIEGEQKIIKEYQPARSEVGEVEGT